MTAYPADAIVEAIAQTFCEMCHGRADYDQLPDQAKMIWRVYARAAYLVSLRMGREPTAEQSHALDGFRYDPPDVEIWRSMTDTRIAEVETLP